MFRGECKEYAGGAMLSVTVVRVSPDLSYARVYVSIFPSSLTGEVLRSLVANNKTIRFLLGRKIGKQMRVVPELRFFADDSLDYIQKIDELLK
jgi:ribosome-binding factor A